LKKCQYKASGGIIIPVGGLRFSITFEQNVEVPMNNENVADMQLINKALMMGKELEVKQRRNCK
jgi:hypothetical protein